MVVDGGEQAAAYPVGREGRPHRGPCQLADALLVEVEDTGEGMSEESISRIFETFFTAREERGGHGLGMPIVRHLVREHSGRIKVLSKVGEGTTVRIWLPAITEEERGSS